jgi:hypothetical protein
MPAMLLLFYPFLIKSPRWYAISLLARDKRLIVILGFSLEIAQRRRQTLSGNFERKPLERTSSEKKSASSVTQKEMRAKEHGERSSILGIG